jgi:saccharopine dehydrogenase (NAD+, L-lysine forming)
MTLMKIGILKETKIPSDNRVPLTPKQCKLILEEFPGTEIIVQPGNGRCFSDKDYRNEGIEVGSDLRDCDVMMGVKEVDTVRLIPGKTYFFFSHTIKKQNQNKNLLRAVLDKHIRLVDYETLTDSKGVRIIGFGRWAGLVGTYNGLRAICVKHHLCALPPPEECQGLEEMMKKASAAKLPPLRIAMTGDGRVAGGSEEMMNAFGITKVTVEDYMSPKRFDMPVYVQLDPEKYNKHKTEMHFDLQHFFNHPEEYESDFNRFCDKTDLLVMAAYWDPRAPVLFTPENMQDKNFRIRVIADITCDLNGSVPSTIRTTTFQEPYYDFNPSTGKEETAFCNPGNITVMSIDNLPCGLPMEASRDFGHNIIKSILPLLLYGDSENIIARATIAEEGKLTANFSYLSDWVDQPD